MAFFAYNPNNNNNRRSHPFWDFVNSMEDLNRRPPSYAPRDGHDGRQSGQTQAPGQGQAQEKAEYKAPTVEDEKTGDAFASKKERRAERKERRAERRAERKGRKREGRDESESSSSSSSSDEAGCDRRRCRGGGRRGMHHHGPPPFGPWGFPGAFAAGDFSDWAGPHGRHGHHHGPGRRQWGPPPPPGPGDHPPPPGPAFGPHGPHGPHGPQGPQSRRRCGGGAGGRRGPGRDFNVAAFLAQLSKRLGIDLNAAAANFGVDLSRVTNGANPDADFVPAHDLFDLENEYLVHVSLPGAHREDIGLDFDGEHHTLRIGGVVYRPNIDETISAAITHSGRNGEVGVFETKVRLPSNNNDLIEVNPANISAKLRDGVLVIHVPKIQKKKEDMKRSIRIDTPSPERDSQNHSITNLAVREKDINRDNPFASTTPNKGKGKEDSHNDMYYSSSAFADSPGTEAGDEHARADASAHNYEAAEAAAQEAARKEAEYDHVMKDHEDPPEELPAYTPSHPDVNDDNEDHEEEGEYVKINVD